MNPRHALFDRFIDFAGLYPPARLPLERAWDVFAREWNRPQGWMLSSFVCPASRLDELAEVIGAAGGGRPAPLRLSVPSTGRLADDLAAAASLQQRLGPGVEVPRVEVALPDDLGRSADPGAVREFAAAAVAALGDSALDHTVLLVEIPLLAPEADPAATVAAIAEGADGAPVGIKIRCGGDDAAAIPEAAAVAAAIVACRDAQLPLKATQGLHRAVRGLDPALGAQRHGFLNIVAAAVLAGLHDLAAEQVEAIVDDEDPQSFRFTDSGFAWEELDAGSEALATARREVFTSVGSCSFDEPVEDMRALRLLDTTER